MSAGIITAANRVQPSAAALGMDVGTSGVRLVALSDDAAIIGEAEAPFAEFRPAGQAIVQDPHAWWTAISEALSELGSRVDIRDAKVLAIDATSGTVIAVDRAGRPLTLGSMYNDRASLATVAKLKQILPENSPAQGVTSPLARMIDLQRPGIYKWLHQADWLSGQFSGRFDVSDENNALKSGFDLQTRRWPAWIEQAIDPQLLPEVVQTGTYLGSIRSGVATQFGLNSKLRVAAGTTDGCASFLASGACSLGDAVTSLGTTTTLKQVCSHPIASAKFGVYSHRLGDLWICGGASNSGGAALLQFFTKQQIIELEARITPNIAMNLNYYPLCRTGERFPLADPDFKPIMTPRPHDDARFLQGLLEGIAAVEKTGYALLRELGAPPLEHVFTVGGGSNSEAWRQIRERTLAVPVAKGRRNAAYGAALIAFSALQQKPLISALIGPGVR